MIFFLKPNPINHHLVVFFLFQKTSLSLCRPTSKETTPTACTWGNLQSTVTVPNRSFTAELIGTYLCSQDAGCLTGHSLQPPRAGLCVVGRMARESGRIASGPSDHLHVNSQTKAPLTRPLSTQAVGLVLLSLHGAWKPLAASRHLANSLWRICHPLQSPEPR